MVCVHATRNSLVNELLEISITLISNDVTCFSTNENLRHGAIIERLACGR